MREQFRDLVLMLVGMFFLLWPLGGPFFLIRITITVIRRVWSLFRQERDGADLLDQVGETADGLHRRIRYGQPYYREVQRSRQSRRSHFRCWPLVLPLLAAALAGPTYAAPMANATATPTAPIPTSAPTATATTTNGPTSTPTTTTMATSTVSPTLTEVALPRPTFRYLPFVDSDRDPHGGAAPGRRAHDHAPAGRPADRRLAARL